mmetsp:Transcript_10969/g.25797  ORF Transcript_10969/g.25797 Transcript_10969/m.25797 type:complete len:724 (+) Transcript_10969:142-2313(+)|eukprot:CAMPEP_0171110234 /NCGR_PEP_ID=MMETSP0766_2-20121228/71233_1 /TAXON_ID=439317 /ORGANISM="Gambierdiscus australes, Strain CAWD 149" /LENGTH=723 /DNA_ID=CAMNT_0011572077 /DNA_START=136 /DNA_END=2307 /DNA_ORIENTATION=+
MKAAMQAAMELEGRLETLENAFEGLQQRLGTFEERHAAFQEQHQADLREQDKAFHEQFCALQEQHNALQGRHQVFQDSCARKADVEGLEQRESVARREMLVMVAQKADLEQLGQCLQAVRHELGEVVKRKANSELVESNLQDLRRELTQTLHDQAEALCSKVVQDLSTKADKADSTQMQQQLRSLEVLANAAARRSELEELDQCVMLMQEKLPGLLQCKADVEAVRNLEAAHVELSQVLQGKADTRDTQASMKAVRQEVLVSMKCKVNSDYMEQRLQAMQAQHAQQAECIEATEQKLSAALQAKADVDLVDQRMQGMQQVLHRELVDRKVECERVENSVEELGQRLDELASSKADREKVVEIVEAVRDEVFAMAKGKSDVNARVEALEEQQSTALREISGKMNTKADEFKVEQRLRMIRQDVVNMVVDKADLDVVTERVRAAEQSVTDQVLREMQAVRQEFSKQLSCKADAEVIDQRFDAIQQELGGEARPRTGNGGSPKRRMGSDTGSTRCSSGGDGEALFVKGPTARRCQSTSRLWKETGSEGTTQVDSWSGSEAATICDMEDWMDHRMKLVKNELIKLVDHKVDMEQVNQIREEITAHVDLRVDQRVQVAQQELTDYVDCRAQAVRKELQADVDLINQCIQQVERTVEAIQQDKPLAKLIRDANQAQQPEEDVASPKAQRAASGGLKREMENYSPDDLRTRRVRDLLTQLVIQPGAEAVQ